jgi:tRNA nucleotidyltransferase (CCA-adding enzyme)
VIRQDQEKNTGVSVKTYLVGGAVRDKLLGIEPHEHDWVVVGASAEEMERQGFQQVGKDFPVFLHPQTQEEYALARTERKAGKGYKGFTVNADRSVTLEQDLSRRDLTINAIAEDPDGNLIDPFGGQRDIRQRLLRHVSDAFVEDPLRVLRIARFWARFAHLGFQVADETLALLAQMVASGELQHLTPERVWKEWEKALATQAPDKFLQLLVTLNAEQQVFPELQITQQVLQHQRQVSALTKDTILRFASLFISQPQRFDVADFCRRLAVPNRYKEAAQLAQAQQVLLLQTDTISSEQYFNLLGELDYWRRPERLNQWLMLKTALQPGIPQQQVRQAAATAATVTAQELLQQGFTGKALGEALTRRRRQVFLEQLER